MPYTDEQQAVIAAVSSGRRGKIIAVNSIAGSGKTSTARGIVEACKPKKGFYTAFNKAIVEDSREKFNGAIECGTLHSLAYRHVQHPKVVFFTYSDVKEKIPYDSKSLVISAVDEFYRSEETDIKDWLRENGYGRELDSLISRYAEYYLDPEHTTFNGMLKRFHLDLVEGASVCHDLLILDECQDTTAVSLAIFKLIEADRKVILGDRFQNIYGFMHTVNAFELLDDTEEYRLTRSFRCRPEIAEIVESYGKKALERRFIFRGNEALTTSDEPVSAVITRTNATLIRYMVARMRVAKSFQLTRDIEEIFRGPVNVYLASKGKELKDRRYRHLSREYERFHKLHPSAGQLKFLSHLQEVLQNDKELQMSCNLLKSLAKDKINILSLKKKVKALSPDPNFILTTAHAFKGLEADDVTIGEDLNKFLGEIKAEIINKHNSLISDGWEGDIHIDNIRPRLDSVQREELNTYYVALSRAKCVLHNNAEID